MNIARGIARWGLAFFIGTFLSAWIFVATLNATVANREVVKNWLAQSGVYKHALDNTLRVTADQSGSLMDLTTNTTLQQALTKTFDSTYIQQYTNKVIDATYDWVEGKAPAITFSIPVQEKSAEFSANLAAEIKPKIEMLPPCNSRIGNLNANQITCIPTGVSADDYAKQLAQPSSSNGFLNTPITQDNLRSPIQLSALPALAQAMHMLLWALPIAVAVCGALFVLASDAKLAGLGRLGRQLTINAGLVLVLGLVTWYVGASLDLNSVLEGDEQQVAIISSLTNPLARTVIPDFGRALSIFSGIVTAVGGILWLGAFLLRRKPQKHAEVPNIPPPAPTEAQLPPPTAKPHA